MRQEEGGTVHEALVPLAVGFPPAPAAFAHSRLDAYRSGLAAFDRYCRSSRGGSFGELAHIDRREGQLQKAESAYRETIAEWKRLGHRAAVAHQLECFAILAQTSEDGRRAAQLYGAAEALRERIGIAMTPAEKTEYDVQIDRLKAGMQAKDFTAAWEAGRAMTLEHAVDFALENQPKTAA